MAGQQGPSDELHQRKAQRPRLCLRSFQKGEGGRNEGRKIKKITK